MVSVYTEVEVDVELSDFDTDDLIDELESRGEILSDGDSKSLVETIWLKRRMGQNFDRELDQLIYQVTGKII